MRRLFGSLENFMKKFLVAGIIFSLFSLNSVSLAAGSPHPGMLCSHLNQTTKQNNAMLKCLKVGKNLKWVSIQFKGITPKPINSANPTANNSNPTTYKLESGLISQYYSGYFADDPKWFSKNIPNQPFQVTNSIHESTNGRAFYYSIQWSGYFIPTVSGIWSFETTSDDASLLWFGKAATQDLQISTSLIDLHGIHAPVTGDAKVTLIAGHVYPILLQYGNATNFDQMDLKVASPGGTLDFGLSGLVFHYEDTSQSILGFEDSFYNNYLSSLANTSKTNSQLPEETPIGNLSDPNVCKLMDPYHSIIGAGFPKAANRLPSVGTIHALMIFVDFSDVKGVDDPSSASHNFIDGMTQFFKEASYGNLSFVFDVYPTYIHLNVDSSKYGMNIHNQSNPGSGNPFQYYHDALSAADGLVDLSKYQVVYVIPPTGISSIVFGPAIPTDPSNQYVQTSKGPIFNGVVGGSDWRNSSDAWVWLAHESGHLLGMPHPYVNYQNVGPVGSPWDLMNAMLPATPDFMGWSKWIQGWISDSQIRCLNSSQAISAPTFHVISPIERTSSATKLIVIKLNSTQVITVELRRNEGVDHVPSSYEGLLVQLVDVSKQSDQGIFTVQEPVTSPSDNGIPVGTLQAPDSIPDNLMADRDTVVVQGIQIKDISSNSVGDLVEISKA